ncbi:MAG: 16S rRNA (guanine(966)-N(2))-methyltransferase RsmD [Flavobacteriaceae bacterium]|jgi:16S rRNA (guanine(966)-N(2))-methyltransferase RsmD|nr:16S rRNA (guanine(966)-N(2))-methyltransferase RsmD [Flavobacteriaceae bacterium]MDG2314233.1 16S rRNA (guanine(966)-N(2))-methyltransferase RsmD [Flavobacteriaceae bacterium]
MRIISGIHKGRRIIAPNNLPVRPTTDRAKEALFNILNNEYYFENISVLDLFAGTGNIGYEFVSRGVQQVVCVDRNTKCTRFIEQTSEILGATIQVVQNDISSFLSKHNGSYDIVFADPPYDMELEKFEQFIHQIITKETIRREGVLIVEHSKYTDLSVIQGFSSSRTYGNCVFSFFRKD